MVQGSGDKGQLWLILGGTFDVEWLGSETAHQIQRGQM